MRRTLGVLGATALLVLSQAAPAHAWAHASYRLPTGSVTYYLDYTVTDHTSWPGLIANHIPKWRQAESASPTFGRGYDSTLARVYVFQGGLTNPSWCGQMNPGSVSGSTMNYGDIGYSNRHSFGTSGSGDGYCDFIQTTLHEFGHALGLSHSGVTAAVMYGSMSTTARHNLSTDDINGIRARY